MRLIASVTEYLTELEPVKRILKHFSESLIPPPISPGRSPPDQTVVEWESTATNHPAQGAMDSTKR